MLPPVNCAMSDEKLCLFLCVSVVCVRVCVYVCVCACVCPFPIVFGTMADQRHRQRRGSPEAIRFCTTYLPAASPLCSRDCAKCRHVSAAALYLDFRAACREREGEGREEKRATNRREKENGWISKDEQSAAGLRSAAQQRFAF